MDLGFMQNWPKELALSEPNTYFIEKINLGLLQNRLIKRIDYVDSLEEYRSKFNCNWDIKPDLTSKIHTIRRDENNRWKAGMNIHFVINSRTKNRFQFAPIVKCVSVQEIEFKWDFTQTMCWVFIDGKSFTTFEKSEQGIEYGENAKKIAHNDGFESKEDFFKYFNEDFKGKLIHWTKLNY